MWQKYINREFMGTGLASEGEKNCVRPISTSLAEGRKWLNFAVLHQEIGIKKSLCFNLSQIGQRRLQLQNYTYKVARGLYSKESHFCCNFLLPIVSFGFNTTGPLFSCNYEVRHCSKICRALLFCKRTEFELRWKLPLSFQSRFEHQPSFQRRISVQNDCKWLQSLIFLSCWLVSEEVAR